MWSRLRVAAAMLVCLIASSLGGALAQGTGAIDLGYAPMGQMFTAEMNDYFSSGHEYLTIAGLPSGTRALLEQKSNCVLGVEIACCSLCASSGIRPTSGVGGPVARRHDTRAHNAAHARKCTLHTHAQGRASR